MSRYLLGRVPIEEYALLHLVQPLIFFAPILNEVLSGGIARFLVRSYAREGGARVTEIVSTATGVLVLGAGALLAVAALVVWQVPAVVDIAPAYKSDLRIMVALLAVSAAFRISTGAFSSGLVVTQRYIALGLVESFAQLIRVGVLFALLLGVGPRVIWVVTATVCGELIATLLKIVLSRRCLPELRFRAAAARLAGAWELVAFGAWSLVQRSSAALGRASFPLVLNHFAGAADVATFGLGSMVYFQVQRLVNAATQPLGPPMIAMKARGDLAAMRAAHRNGGRYSLWLGTACLVPLAIYRVEFCQLFLVDSDVIPEEMAAVVLVSAALVPLRFGNNLVRHVAAATGKIKPLALTVAATQGLAITLAILAVSTSDERPAVHAAGAWLIAYVLIHGPVVTVVAQRLLGGSVREWIRKAWLPGMLPGAVGALVWWPLRIAFAPDSWTALVACGLGGACAFAAGLWCTLSPAERRDLRRVLRRQAS